MPWQTDPVVDDAPSGGGGWQADPVVEEAPAKAPPMSDLEARGRRFAQGGTLGFSDEAGAKFQQMLAEGARVLPRGVQEALGVEGVDPERFPGTFTPQEFYREAREGNRMDDARAREQAGWGWEVAGGLVPMAIPGAATLPGAVAMGAAAGLGASEADLTRGEVGEAALDTALGAGAGLAGEALGRGAGKVVGAVAKPLARAASKFAGGRALSALGMMKGGRKRLGEQLEQAGQFALDEGVVKPFRGVEGSAEALAKVESQAGQRIGEIVKTFERVRQTLGRRGMLPPQAGAPPLSGEALAQQIEQNLVKPLLGKPGSRGLAASYQAEANAFRTLGDAPMSFDDMAAQVRAYNDPSKFHTARAPEAAQAARDVRQLLRTEQDRYLQQVADVADKAMGQGAQAKNLVQELRDQKQRYGLAARLGDEAVDRMAGWGANRVISLSDMLAGQAGGVGGAVLGGPVGALAAIPLGVLNKVVRTYGDSIAGPSLQALSRAVEAGAPALQRWAPMLSRAAGESPEALLALHQSLLSDPEYQAALAQGGTP